MARTMQDAQKLNGVGGDPIADQKWKAIELKSTNAATAFRPALRGGHDGFDSGLRGGDEVMAQANFLLLVVTSGGNQVGLELGMIPTNHPSEARALRKTSAWDLG